MTADQRRPRNFEVMRKSPSRSSKAATGALKSRGLARPLAPMAPELGQAKGQAVVFADVSASLFLCEDNAKFDAARDDADLARRDIENAEFRVKAKSAELGNDQQFAIGGVEETILHRGVGGVDVDGDALSASQDRRCRQA